MQTLTYEIINLPNQKVSIKRLEAELAFIGFPPEGVIVKDGQVCLYYLDETTLNVPNIDTMLANHSGEIYPNIEVLASQTMMNQVFEVHNVNEWQTIGAQLLRPGKLHRDISSLITQMIAEVSVTGSDGEVRMVEVLPDKTVRVITNPHPVLAINSGNWEAIDVFSNVDLTDSFNRYEVQARKTGEGSFILRNITTTLIRLF